MSPSRALTNGSLGEPLPLAGFRPSRLVTQPKLAPEVVAIDRWLTQSDLDRDLGCIWN